MAGRAAGDLCDDVAIGKQRPGKTTIDVAFRASVAFTAYTDREIRALPPHLTEPLPMSRFMVPPVLIPVAIVFAIVALAIYRAVS